MCGSHKNISCHVKVAHEDYVAPAKKDGRKTLGDDMSTHASPYQDEFEALKATLKSQKHPREPRSEIDASDGSLGAHHAHEARDFGPVQLQQSPLQSMMMQRMASGEAEMSTSEMLMMMMMQQQQQQNQMMMQVMMQLAPQHQTAEQRRKRYTQQELELENLKNALQNLDPRRKMPRRQRPAHLRAAQAARAAQQGGSELVERAWPAEENIGPASQGGDEDDGSDRLDIELDADDENDD